MNNVCLDCGRQFSADHHTDQCHYCWERETETFAENRSIQRNDDVMLIPHTKSWYQERLGVSGKVDE